MNDRLRVSVVDDDVSVRRALYRLLRAEGYCVETFASGSEFLLSMEEGGAGPGCIVLDVRLPGPSGFDVIEILATTGNVPPVILITGHGDPLMAERAAKAGCVRFLTKPFDSRMLLDAVKEALRQDRPA